MFMFLFSDVYRMKTLTYTATEENFSKTIPPSVSVRIPIQIPTDIQNSYEIKVWFVYFTDILIGEVFLFASIKLPHYFL